MIEITIKFSGEHRNKGKNLISNAISNDLFFLSDLVDLMESPFCVQALSADVNLIVQSPSGERVDASLFLEALEIQSMADEDEDEDEDESKEHTFCGHPNCLDFDVPTPLDQEAESPTPYNIGPVDSQYRRIVVQVNGHTIGDFSAGPVSGIVQLDAEAEKVFYGVVGNHRTSTIMKILRVGSPIKVYNFLTRADSMSLSDSYENVNEDPRGNSQYGATMSAGTPFEEEEECDDCCNLDSSCMW